ncbi:MAG: hypothetical protein IJU23_09915 [Proteobacteria bacterium]|nr:hypothetical protein [Pseudomonadota bacterium]
MMPPAIEGLYTILFAPLLICTLAGLCVAWKNRREKYICEIIFAITIFIIMLAWRLPVVTHARYLLPLLVPGVLIATVFLKSLYKRNHPWRQLFVWILLVIISAVGIAKAMRPQDAKPYLYELPIVVSDETRNGKISEVCVIELGNIGGHVEFTNSTNFIKIYSERRFDKAQKAFLQSLDALDIHSLLLKYPRIYIYTASQEKPEVISELFSQRYRLPFELSYQFKRPRNKGHVIMYRIRSPYACGYLTDTERMSIYNNYNLLPDPELKRTSHVGNHKNLRNAAPIKDPVAHKPQLLYQSKRKFACKKQYQLLAQIRAHGDTYFYIDAKQWRQSKLSMLRRITSKSWQQGQHEFQEIFNLNEYEGEWILEMGIVGSAIEIEKLSLVDADQFGKIKN